jgi:hypothetical protein
MYRKLCLLTSFVLVFALACAVKADPIDVNNGSFEYDSSGAQITGWTGWYNVGGWTLRDTTGWAGGWWGVTNDWGPGYEAADGTVASFNVTGFDPCDANTGVCKIEQILDDPNAVIAANKRYTLTFNAIRTTNDATPIALGELFYSTGEGEANDVVLAYESRVLTAPTFGTGYEGWEEITISCTIPSDSPAIGEPLGVKLSNPYPWISGYPVAMDNVRVEWDWDISAINVDLDIKHGGCPNPLNVKSNGVLPVAILGTEELDVSEIDTVSLLLNGVPPVRHRYKDTAAPLVADADDCSCTTEGADGFTDLVLKFKTRDIVATLGDVNDVDELELSITGFLKDGTPIEGTDCIIIRDKHKPKDKAYQHGRRSKS